MSHEALRRKRDTDVGYYVQDSDGGMYVSSVIRSALSASRDSAQQSNKKLKQEDVASFWFKMLVIVFTKGRPLIHTLKVT